MTQAPETSTERPAMTSFLWAGRAGRWQWYWALLGTALACAVTAGVMLAIFALVDASGAEINVDVMLRAGSIGGFAALLLLGVALMSGVAASLVLVHGRHPAWALGRDSRFLWRDFFKAVGAGLLVALVFHGIGWLCSPGDYRWLERTWSDLPWMLLGAALILPQSFGEEYAFRGYLARIWGAVVPVRWFIIALMSGLFAWLHAENADVARDLAFNLIGFVAVEVVLYWLYFRTENLATTAGLHWLNNTFVLLAITISPDSISQLALAEYVDPVATAGGSRLTEPWAYVELALSLALLLLLLVHPRSPFFLPRYQADERR